MGEGIRAQLDEQGDTGYEAEWRAIVGYGKSGYAADCRVWTDSESKDLFTTSSAEKPLPQGFLHPPAEKQPEVGGFTLFNIPERTAMGRTYKFRALWMRQVSGPQITNILVARSSHHVYHESVEFLQLLLWFGGGIMLAALLLVPRIVSWGLRPICYAGRHLDQITHRNLQEETQTMGEVPVELQPFKSALDGMLVRLNKAVQQQKQLTADVTHELRTPLAIMKSTLQTLRMKPRTVAECEEGMDDALRDMGRMEQLVAQLLTLARLDAVDEVANPTEVRLDLLLESLAEVFDGRAESQGAKVVLAERSAIVVHGDENELRQLFTNLLDNALRYGPPGGVIRINLEDGPGSRATVCVHDDGGAIPPESLPHLFDRFYRVDPSRSQACGGAGLGLAIAHQIVQRHHGDIMVTSTPQTGTSVTVQLPLLEESGHASHPESSL
jgi:two-component system heavy metal sensor histidine kinase CusS